MRVSICKVCLSLPRYANAAIVFDRVGCGLDCALCEAYMQGDEGVVIWIPTKDKT